MSVEVTGESLEVHSLQGATIIALGQQNLTRQIDISPLMQRIADIASESSNSIIVLDCRRVESVGSILLGELISLNEKLVTDGKQLRLAGLNPEAKTVLKITGLSGMLSVYPDIKAAVFAKTKRRWWWPFG